MNLAVYQFNLIEDSEEHINQNYAMHDFKFICFVYLVYSNKYVSIEKHSILFNIIKFYLQII